MRDAARLLAPLRDRDATREAINIICTDASPIHSERCRAMQSMLLGLHTQRTALRDVKDAQIIRLASEALENYQLHDKPRCGSENSAIANLRSASVTPRMN